MDAGGYFSGKEFFCEVVWGTTSSQRGTLPKRTLTSRGRAYPVGQKMQVISLVLCPDRTLGSVVQNSRSTLRNKKED